MGNIEPSLIRTPSQDNTKGISIPIEVNTIRPSTRETRELMNEGKNPRIKEEVERAEKHEEAGCEKYGLEDIDDNPNNDTHTHDELNDEELDKWADYVLEDNDIEFVFTKEEVKEQLKKYWENDDFDGEEWRTSIEDTAEKVKEDMGEDAENLERGRSR